MSSESPVKPTVFGAKAAPGGVMSVHDPAWRKTFAAALRVIDHHRANLDARMTIQRLRHEEPRRVSDSGSEPSGRD